MTGTAETSARLDSARSDEEILSEARSRFAVADEADAESRRLAIEDIRFRSGEQWPEEMRRSRAKDNRPCLTINRIPGYVNLLTNDQRQNRASIKVSPIDDAADVETAKVIQGLIRHIEYNSNADVAYDTAYEGAVTGGFGFFRVVTQYKSPESFEQEILIRRIRNPLSVRLDPFSQEPDGSDANWAFVVEDLSREEFQRLYPQSKYCQPGGWDGMGEDEEGWKTAHGCRVAEYLCREWKTEDIVLLSTGQTVKKSELPSILPEGVAVLKERTAKVPVIRWYKLSGAEILERTDWLGIYIPIIPVYGQEIDINGKRILEGVVRNAKDPARMYNIWASAETEAIALAPRAPYIAAEGQIEGHEAEWEDSAVRNIAVLRYKPTSVAGTPVPPPQRNAFEPAVQAITQARMLASDDLKATTGIYDASTGARSNETSGVAIQRRNVQAQTSNFHFVDNLRRSQRHCGRILIDLIPKVYDTAQAARIIGDEGDHKIVRINEPFEENGKTVLYDLSTGKYDVAVSNGPSFESRRQEAVASMMEVTRAVPKLMEVAGDLLVKSMDWPGSQEIADRLKKTLPPGLAEDPEKKQPLPPQVQAQMQQMGAMIEQLSAKLNEATDAIQHKRVDLESRERIEMKKLEVQLEIERAKLDAKDALALLSAEIDEINARTRLLRANQPVEDVTKDSPMPMAGAPGPMPGPAAPQVGIDPTGGGSPGTPMENFPHDQN